MSRILDLFKFSERRRNRLIHRQEREIRSLYKESYKEISRSLKQIEKINSESSVLKKVYLTSVQKEIESSMVNVDKQTETTITNNMNVMVDLVLQNNKTYLSGLGYTSYINNSAMRQRVVENIMSGKLYGGKYGLSSAIWGDNQKKIMEIEKIISKGIIEGKSIYQIAQSLEKYVNPSARKQWDWSKMFPGSRKQIDYNAQRLARTTLNHAYQQAFVEATYYNPFITAYKWVTSGGEHVCPLCIERETEDKYGLGAGVFPKDELPLDHPNGMCSVEVVVTMSDQEIQDAITDWYYGMGDEDMNEALDIFAEHLQKS